MRARELAIHSNGTFIPELFYSLNNLNLKSFFARL
ncbi:hypothetical protein OR1_00160 [Geobacter sp. OR-1]|nr:hypothetical protein OR1_00160 [Geobacter sp. OR-1]